MKQYFCQQNTALRQFSFSFLGGIQFLVDLLTPSLGEPISNRGLPIPIKMQILITLRYLGTGDLQNTVADTVGISQSSVSRCIERVCTALVKEIDRFIHWPRNESQQKERFFNIAGFPSVVGIIDGSHIRIQEPKVNPNAFINRKYFPSINICAVCDVDCKFTFLSVRWPGSCHDSFILRQTGLWDSFENDERSGIILGDSGYPCRKWLLTPYSQSETPAQEAYNHSLTRTRVKIECAFGQLKKRFRALHGELRVSPAKAPSIITACVILQNIAIDLKMPEFDSDDIDIQDVSVTFNEPLPQNGFEMRKYITDSYFS